MEWNGTAWTTYPDTDLGPAYHRNGVGFGSTEAALYSNHTSFNKEWNGTAWSSISNTTFDHTQGSGGGTVNDGVVFGGRENSGYSNAYHNDTEIYDGTNWSTGPTMSTARMSMAGGGSSTAAFMVGSWDRENTVSVACCTEEYTEGSLDTTLVKTITGSAYSY